MLDIVRLKFLIEKSGQSQKDFALKINRSEAWLYDLFKTKSTKRQTVEKIAKELGVAPEFLYEGSGQLPDKSHKPNVTYVPLPVQAGFFAGFGDKKPDLLKFSMPGVSQGDFYMFDVAGDSMTPTICNGDQVICEKVDKVEEIRPMEAHVVFLKSDGVVLKRMRMKADTKADTLTLISDNEFYPPYDVRKKEVQSIYRIRKVISSDLTPKTYKR